jgi:hypothetical protein
MSEGSRESWDEYRKGILRETSRFIEWGLRHPELTFEIPIKPSGDGGFPAQVARWFWGVVLTDRRESWITRWRDVLLRRPRLGAGCLR